jgi:predicted Rdx family selenoprotein
LPEATREAARIKKDLGIDVELIAGKGGVFDVRADGKVIYSKNITDRFPNPGEVTALLRKVKN